MPDKYTSSIQQIYGLSVWETFENNEEFERDLFF